MHSIEIERKFLVINDDFKNEAIDSYQIKQGFLSSVPERTVRVRLTKDKGFLTVKGIGNDTGTSRFEWEKEIDLNEATSLFNLCEPYPIEKIRHIVKVGKHHFEVDEFLGENKGLIIAEIELQDEKEPFEKPEWLGEEVTGIVKYYNSVISKNPYSTWS